MMAICRNAKSCNKKQNCEHKILHEIKAYDKYGVTCVNTSGICNGICKHVDDRTDEIKKEVKRILDI